MACGCLADWASKKYASFVSLLSCFVMAYLRLIGQSVKIQAKLFSLSRFDKSYCLRHSSLRFVHPDSLEQD